HPLAMMVLFAAFAAVTAWGLMSLPTGFLPTEDQGYFIVSAQLPDAASQERTGRVVERLNDILLHTPGIENVNAFAARNVFDGTPAPNGAGWYVTFKDWDQRSADESQAAILGRLNRQFNREIPQAIVVAFPPPAIRGLGVAGGFQLEVQDTRGVGLTELAD